MKRADRKPENAKPTRSALVQIEKPIYGGAFLARMEGKATFVPLTLPGEEARVRIMEEKRGYAVAEAEEIVIAAPERVVPGCRHFGVCGGCHYQHANYEAQLGFKQAILRETLERGGVSAPETIDVLAGKEWQYRNRIRLAFDGAGRVGYRARRSHDLVPISECPIASPLLVRAALSAAEILRDRRRVCGRRRFRFFQTRTRRKCWQAFLCATRRLADLTSSAMEWKKTHSGVDRG